MTLQVIEYEEIDEKKIEKIVKNTQKAKKIFKELEQFAQDNENRFLIYSRSGRLKSQNYVGIIETKSGFVVEILPKIAKNDDKDASKSILLKMLRFYDKKFHHFQLANLKTKKLPLYEIFISMFLDEMDIIRKRGIKHDYITKEQNQKFLKGKLKLSDHIRQNFAHQERFFVAYDEYLPNRVENRILKTTLLNLAKITKSIINQQRIREFLFVLDEVEPVTRNIAHVFSRIEIDRTMEYYTNALAWAKLFLIGKSFTPYKGDSIAFALLFDMNNVFERYVGRVLKKQYKNVKLQHSKYCLFDESCNRFRLKPDIVINDGEIIADTKWKIVESEGDISQNDLYQIFAYAAKYENCKKVLLIYPKINDNLKITNYFNIREKKNIAFQTCFVDLQKPQICDEHICNPIQK